MEIPVRYGARYRPALAALISAMAIGLVTTPQRSWSAMQAPPETGHGQGRANEDQRRSSDTRTAPTTIQQDDQARSNETAEHRAEDYQRKQLDLAERATVAAEQQARLVSWQGYLAVIGAVLLFLTLWYTRKTATAAAASASQAVAAAGAATRSAAAAEGALETSRDQFAIANRPQVVLDVNWGRATNVTLEEGCGPEHALVMRASLRNVGNLPATSVSIRVQVQLREPGDPFIWTDEDPSPPSALAPAQTVTSTPLFVRRGEYQAAEEGARDVIYAAMVTYKDRRTDTAYHTSVICQLIAHNTFGEYMSGNDSVVSVRAISADMT